MFDEKDRKYFYDEFKNNGYEVGSYEDFKKDLNNKEDRDWYYNEAKNMGYDVGTQADFDKMVLEATPSSSSSAPDAAPSNQEVSTSQSGGQSTTMANKSKTTPSSTGGTNDKTDKPGLVSKALGMLPKIDAGNMGKEQKIANVFTGLLGGGNQPQAPTPSTPSVVNDNTLMDAKFANYLEDWKKRPDKEGTYFENFVADLEAEGMNPEDAIQATRNALNRYASRSSLDVTNKVVSSLEDGNSANAEENVTQQWYSHPVQDQLKQEAANMGIRYDDYVAHYLKPSMVKSLVQKYGSNYRNIAEGIATRLYAHDEHVQERLMNQDINEALSDVISKYTSTSVAKAIQDAEAASNAQMGKYNEQSKYVDSASPFSIGAISEANKTRDPQKILGDLQKKFGKLYQNSQFLNDMSSAAFKVMQRYGMNGTLSGDPKQFKPMINAAIKNELDQLEVKGMMPRGSADYILKTGIENTIIGKVSRKLMQTDYQNWLEDIANQQYQPGFWERVGSGALTFAGDAWSYWLPGAAGGKLTKNMIAKAEGRLASDLMAKGMETKMAERAAKVLIGKSKGMALKSGAAHGAVTFGGQSAISKPIDEIYRTGQFDENGNVYNPSVGKIIANTLGEVTKQSAVGAIMQGGTVANMVGKGRGLATNILADVGGKAVDSSIMAGQQILERMAQDPNFKPTGKDFAESALESMASLTAIGLPGMVGKYARFKDAKEFNRKYDFNEQDLSDLKRLGYDSLRDAFEKVGIGEYAVTGDNAQRLEGQLTQKYMDMMNDKSVPETLKAKMMAVVEGKRPSSFSPVVDSIIVQPMDNDGKVYLETLNKDGGIIDRKEYSSREDAEKADKKLEYEKTLGLASVLEGEFHNEFTQEHLESLYNQAAQKYNMGEKLTDEEKAAVYLHQNAGTINQVMQKQQKGIILTDEEQKQVDAYRHFYESALENSSVMREFVNTFEDSHGVARGTLRKALESRDKKYAPLVESYLKELYNSIELKREMKQTVDDLYNTSHGRDQERLEQSGAETGGTPVAEEGSSVSTPYQDRTNSVPSPSDANSAANLANSSSDVPPTEPPTPPVEGETPTNAEGTPLMGNDASPSDANTASNESKSDAYVMGQNAYQNSDAEGLKAIDRNDDVSKARLKRAFADDEAKMDVVVKAYEEDKDLEQFVAQRANSMTPAQQDAVRKYVEAQDAKKGVYDALQHADDGYGDALKEQLWPYQTEDGNIVPATLTTGQQVFLKKANEYGGGFVVVPGEDGNPTIKQVSSAEIKEVGTPIPLDDYINQRVTEQKNARIQQFFAQYDGSGLKPSDTVEVAMEAGEEPMQMTFAGYSEDGKIVLSDGKDNIALTRDEFNAWRKNALDASIGAELDAEDAQRANDDAAKAEADKKQRYNEGIVGLGMGQPDYSSKDTEPKVAAEYLQEQFGNDHGKLLNLISGSRSDIKEQLDNKRKAASKYEDWLSLNADLDPEKAQKVENDLALVNEQIADLETRYKNWNAIRKEVMTPEEARTLKNERKAEIEKAGVDENAIASNDEREVAVLDNKELKKQYPTMDEASNYIASERKRIYHIQNDEVQPQIDGINKALEQYMNGDIDYSANQLMELNTTKAQLEARQANLSASAKDLKAQDKLLNTLYSAENKEERAKAMEEMTPSEQRKALVADAFKKNDLGAIKEIYKDASIDVMDLTPQTLEEAVSEALRPHSLNAESLQAELGKDNFKYGIGKGYDSNKYNYLLAKKGTGLSVNEFAVRVYNDLPINLQELGYSDQDVRNTLLDMFKTYDNVKEMRNVAFLNRIAAAENELASEEEYYEAQKEREIIERQAEIEEYNSYIQDKALSLPTESELNAIEGMEYDRMMEIEDREREYKEYVKSILPELADYDDRSNEEGYGGGGGLGSDSSRRGVVEGNRQGEEIGGREASSESKTGEGTDSGRTGRQEAGSLERGKGSAIRGTHLPQEASFGERLKSAIAETEPNPSEAQKKAGNYKKGHLQFGGYDFTVETPKGVTRSGKDEHGKPWSVTMHDTYGYILGKIGVDGDHIDMFINDGADLDNFDGNVYVVDQVNPETGEFDEHKVMYGYPSEEAATEAYLANYSKGWKGLGKVTAVPKATFDKWLESSDRKTKPFADYAMVQKEQRAAYKEEMMQDGAHSEAFEKIVELAKEQKEYWDLMEQGEVEPDDVPEVDVAFDMDELLKTLSDEEFKEVSDVLKGIDEEFEYYTADEYERREGAVERKKKAENAKTYEESIKEALKPVTPVAIALKSAVESGDKKAIKQAQKELTEALIASDLGLDYLSGQLAQAKLVKKKDELYKLKRATVKPLTDAIHAIETAENIENSDFIAQMEYDYENDIHPSEEDMPKMQKFVERLLDFHSDKEEKTDSGYTILSSNIQGDKLYPNEKKWFGTGKYRKGVSWVDKQNNCAYEVNPRFNNRGYLSAVGVHKIVPLIKFDRDVKEVKPSEMTEAQKVAFDAVSTMLKKAGIPVKVISNEEMEKVAEEQDNLAISMLMSDPRLRFNIKTPEQKKAAKAAYDWATEHRPDKYAQYAIVNMDKPNMMPEYFEKKSLAEQWRKYYTNAWRIGNYKAFDLNKPFEEQIKNVVGNVPDEFDPYKVDRNREKISDLKKQIKETRALLDAAGNERIAYQNQLMQQYMDEHGLSSENEVPDDVWMKSRQTAMLEYSSKRRELEAKLQDLENQQKTVVEPRISFMRTYHGSGADFSEFDFDHMSEGAGSQFFGWGGYVSSSKKIGKDYAMLAKGDDKGLNFDIKGNVPFYVEDTLRHYIYKNQDIDKGLDNAREDLKKTLETFPDNEIDEDVKELSKVLAKNNDDIVDIKNPSYLYEVNIPDDNGSNYLDWYGKVTQKLKDKAFNALFDEKKNNYISVLKENGFTNKQVERAVSSLDEGEYKKAFDKAETGEGFYNAVSNMIVKSKSESHDDKAASKFLSSLGFTGIKYPAGTILGGAEDGDTNYVIFNPEDMQIVDHNKFAKGKGTVYGYTDGNEIVLNLEHLNPNTPIHEYQHIWRTAAKAKNPELIAHGDKLIKETEWFKDLQNDPNYKHLSEDKLCDEAFARLTGDEGEAILEQMAKDAIKENPLDTAKELSIINRLKKWLKQFWYWTLETFTKWKPEDIEKMTLQDIRNLVLRDLAQGVDPRTVLNEKKTKKADDDKTLAGVHNITEEKLRKALKLDGLANPSLAVIDTAKNGHNNFGEISFIAPSALVDKRTGNTAGTWTTDAYTQRYPSVERQMTEKGYEKFKKWVDGLEYSSADKSEILRQAKDVLENNGVPAWELMYLKEKGIDIKAYDSQVDYRWKEIFENHPTAEDILESMKNDPELNDKVTSLARSEIIFPVRNEISKQVRKQIYAETGVKVSPISPKVRAKVNEIFKRDYAPKLLNNDGSVRKADVKKVVEDMVKQHDDTKKYSFYLSKVKASSYVNQNGLYPDYIRWQENKLDEFGTKNRIFRGYKRDGSRKYVPETLENVSKAMVEDAEGQTNGGEYTSFGSFIAKLANRVDSTDEMRANKDKLSTNEDKEKFYEKWEGEYYDLAKFLYNDVMYGERRLHDIVLQSDPKKYAKKEYGITLTPSFMKKLDALKDAVQKELKSGYFETKFDRPVHLDEFVAAVVPSDLATDVRKGLEKSGLSLYEYDPKKEGDRQRAFDVAVNSKEGIRFMFAGEKGAAEADKAEKVKSLKQKQHEIVTTANPMLDDYHTGIRKVEDIKTFAEAMEEARKDAEKYGFNEWSSYPDETNDILQDALDSGEITIYSSKPIVNGNFVTPSFMQANDYAGGGKVYSKTVPVENVAWINVDEGQYAKVTKKALREVMETEEQGQRMDNLKVAKKMERGKKNAKAIKMATGWERGADDKWRYEVPDIKRYDSLGNLAFKRNHPDYARYAELNAKNAGRLFGIVGNDFTDAEEKEFESLKKKWGGLRIEKHDNVSTLDAYIDAPEVFKAYPKLGSIELKFINDPNVHYSGVYKDRDKEIVVNKAHVRTPSDIKKTLVHEMQHAIQNIEGFAKGGNMEYVRFLVKERMNAIENAAGIAKNALEEYRDIATHLVQLECARQWRKNPKSFLRSSAKYTAPGYGPFTPKKEQIEIGQRLADDWVDGALYFIQSRREWRLPGELDAKDILTRWKKEWAKKYSEWKDFKEEFDQLDKAIHEKTDYELYQALAGEVESRNVETRIDMTPEERRNSLASETEDVNRDEQILMNVGDASYSIVKDSEAIFVLEQRKINNEFNDALEKQMAGTLPKGYTYKLGNPSSALKFAGIDDLPIELSSRTLEVKSSKDYKSNHPFDLASIKNLPIAIQRPVAIFDSEYEDGRKVILTELKDDKGHSIIAVLGLRKLRGRNYAEVNSIISLYGKDSAVRIANWFDSTNKNGLGLDKQLCRWADTKKASEWLTNNVSYVHSVGLSPKRIAKIINSFVNNQFPEENLLIKHNFGNVFGENDNMSVDEERKIADSVVNTANQLGGAEANVYTSLDDVPEEYRSEVEQGAKGWYDPETHTVHVYLPNCENGNDAQRTVFHEKIGHEGMEVLLGGEQGVRKFANFVYQSADKETRGKILDFANKYDPHWQNPDRINIGTQEYIAHLAEEGPTTAEDFSLWTKIKHYLIKALKKLGIRIPGLLNDKDLRYYLMKAGKALHVWDNMPKEKQEAMMAQASNAEIRDALSDGAGKGKPRQKKGESAIQYMKRVMEWRKWKNAREDTEDPEPPMFYDFDKDANGKKEWERLNKEWRDAHHLQGDEMPLRPERTEGESDESFLGRYKEWEKWNDAMGDKENPMPDMFSFEKSKQDEARQKYEDWLTRHELNEQQQADLDLYEGKIYPAETSPEADILDKQVMQDLAEVTSTDVSKESAATTVKHAVIHRRKNMEEASADDAIYINDVKSSIEKMADSGILDKLLSDYQGKSNKAEKLAEAIPYIIEAPRRIRELAYKLNSTGVFGEGHIHITPNDVEAIQKLRPELAKVTAKTHTEVKNGKEVKLFDDMKGATEVASKVANIINGNHEKEPGFVPIDGTDILNKNVLPIILKKITPWGVDYKELSEPMKSVLDSIRDWYNYTFDWLKDNDTLKADTGFTVDYVNHLWDKEKSDKQAYAMYVENRQRTKSPNEKPREINTLMEGQEVGLVPKTTDITKMMAYYSRSNIEAWANKAMLQEVSGLNVIERNEDGEIISSDPLLSSVAPFNLEQYKYFEIPGVGPVWVYNVSPKQVTVKTPITGKDKVLYREASAGDRFGVVFDTYQSSPFWKTFDTLASSMKKLELGFSGFHAGALTEVYMVQNMVEYGPKKALANFVKYIFADTMKNHQLPCFANPQDFQEAATHLVKFGATNDYAAADVQNMFDNFRDAMMKIQEKLGSGNVVSKAGATVSLPFKVASQMLSLINKGMDRALWDFLHDGLKLATYNMRAEKTKARAKAKGWTDEQLSKVLDEDGQFVNDMFGGQHWDVLGASHRTLRYAGRVLLSPDWNASTTRHFLALTGYGSVWNEATWENFKEYYKRLYHKNLTPEDEGRRARQVSSLLCYGLGFMVFYEAIANGINAAFRALDEEKERKKAEELRKTNANYRSPYELAYPDGMKWYDYLMRGNSLGQQSKIFMGRYADGTEMYIRHGKQFREVPEYLFNHKGELEFPGPMVQRMIGKANPMVRMTLDDINYLSDFQASHADQEIQRKYGKTIGLLYKDALYWAPFLIPSQENKEFKAVDFFFPSSKGFSPWKAQSYFKDFILSGDMEGVVMTYQSCERNGIDPEAQIKAAIGSVKALESAEMKDGITSLQVASERFDEAKSITEKKKMRQKMKKFLSQSEYKAFTQKEALDMVQSYLNGDDDLKEMEKAENKYLMKAKSEDVTEDWRIQAVWNGTMETYDEYQRLKDVDKAKANAFKNSKTNKRLFAARKAISAAKKKMNKAKKQMDGQNDAAKMVEIRKTRKELLKTLNGME